MATLAKVVPIPKGAYSASATYNSLDIVRYNGKSWMCKVDGITNIAPSEGTYWMMLAQDGGGATNLTSLSDVTVSSPTNNQILLYNSTSGQWENKTLSQVSSLNDLSDVTLSGQSNGQALIYDSATGKWKNITLAWNSLTGKPFNTIDTNQFTTTNNQLSMRVPEYYIEVDGDSLSGNFQTESEPVILPAGALSKPFIVTLKNIGVQKNWRTGGYYIYVKENGDSTVYQINVFLSSNDTYNKDKDLGTTIYLTRSFTTGAHRYTGDYIRLRYFPQESVITNNAFYTVDASRDTKKTSLKVHAYTQNVDTSGTHFDVDIGCNYILFVYNTNATTYAINAVGMYYIGCPNVTSPVPKLLQIKSAGSTMSVTVENADTTHGKVTITSASSTYTVSYSCYELAI